MAQAIGSNVFDVLLGLGLPWTVKSLVGGSETIKIRNSGMLVSCYVTLLLTISVLLVFYVRKFVLCKRLGVVMICVYVVYLVVVVTIEVVLYTDYKIPMCRVD